ncbi:MAG: MBOAT family O-acyltransferase, partial [Pyrinomonadaceae bacterium]
MGKRRAVVFLSAYLVLIGVHFLAMRLFSGREGWLPWLAFFSPIIALIIIKYLPLVWEPLVQPFKLSGEAFVGISYMSLRLSYLVLEVRNHVVEKPGFWQYLGFSFFVPTFVVGPINPYSVHERSLRRTDREVTPKGRAALRIIVGAAKFQVLAPLFNQLSYSGLILDSHPHPPSDLVVAAVSYYLFLYCNFAGFCDMAIGVAGLLGIHERENFQNPLAARNVRDFWNRWHITLSDYMRDVVFTPLSKFLAGRFGIPTDHAVALAILAVFLLV